MHLKKPLLDQGIQTASATEESEMVCLRVLHNIWIVLLPTKLKTILSNPRMDVFKCHMWLPLNNVSAQNKITNQN